jgi:hypothetical protein
MINQIQIGTIIGENESFLVDADKIVMGRTFLAAITRYGKSWCARRLVEQLYGKAGIIIIDPEGEYASLREKFLFLILGQDVTLQTEDVKYTVDKILEKNLSVIIDLSLIDEEYGKKYVSDFIKHLMFIETKLRKPYLVVVEEADQFAPEKGVATSTCLEAMKNLAKKGGKRGVGAIFATQRPAFVSKMILSQCTTLKLIGRIEWPSDLEAIKDFLQIEVDVLRQNEDSSKPHIDRLNPGEFYASGSALDRDAFIKVGDVQTTHLGSTPKLDSLPKPLDEDIKNVIGDLKRLTVKEQITNERITVRKTEARMSEDSVHRRQEEEMRNLMSNRNPYVYQLYRRLEKDSEEPTLHSYFSEDELALLLHVSRDSEQFRTLIAELDKYPGLIEHTSRGYRKRAS